MRTVRALTVSPSMLCAGRVYLVLGGGGVSAWGCLLLGGVCSGGGAPGPGGRGSPAQVLPPLWTEFLTHAYENITLPQTSFAGGNENRCECRLFIWKPESYIFTPE